MCASLSQSLAASVSLGSVSRMRFLDATCPLTPGYDNTTSIIGGEMRMYNSSISLLPPRTMNNSLIIATALANQIHGLYGAVSSAHVVTERVGKIAVDAEHPESVGACQ